MKVWIDSRNELLEVFESLTNEKYIGLDTEFIRTNTFFPELALIQLSDGEKCWLVDVLSINDPTIFKAFFESGKNQFVMHACAEDLEVLHRAYDIELTNIFDTQVAANFLNIRFCIGYANLVDTLLNIQLEKSMTRSNWLQRPLSEAQKLYAALDVMHLPKLYKLMNQMLIDADKKSSFDEEMQYLLKWNYRFNVKEAYYKKIKGAWRLNDAELVRLYNLSYWRETEAEETDIPRARVLEEKSMLDLAIRNPRITDDLYYIDSIHRSKIKRYGIKIIDILCKCQEIKPERPEKPLQKNQRQLFKSLKSDVNRVAEENDLPPQFLCSKKELEIVVRNLHDNERLISGFRTTWRYHLFDAIIEKHQLSS